LFVVGIFCAIYHRRLSPRGRKMEEHGYAHCRQRVRRAILAWRAQRADPRLLYRSRRGWRIAFIVPGIISILIRIAYHR
jgi:hypothetical protein